MLPGSDQLHAVHNYQFGTYIHSEKSTGYGKRRMKICILLSVQKLENPTALFKAFFFVAFCLNFVFFSVHIIQILVSSIKIKKRSFLKICKAEIAELSVTKEDQILRNCEEGMIKLDQKEKVSHPKEVSSNNGTSAKFRQPSSKNPPTSCQILSP